MSLHPELSKDIKTKKKNRNTHNTLASKPLTRSTDSVQVDTAVSTRSQYLTIHGCSLAGHLPTLYDYIDTIYVTFVPLFAISDPHGPFTGCFIIGWSVLQVHLQLAMQHELTMKCSPKLDFRFHFLLICIFLSVPQIYLKITEFSCLLREKNVIEKH